MSAPLRVWAPHAKNVAVVTTADRRPLQQEEQGWWRGMPAEPDADYAFALDGGEPRPDPRSRWQPHGIHGPSRPHDHATFPWTDQSWRGRSLAGNVMYELHVGTFTPEGTFAGAAERLDHLVDLGVDFVEVMPVNAFPGRWGWGYDGVHLYAVHDAYGGPDGLKSFVNACHEVSIGVVLDVVYNHLGPEGNYLPEFGPYFTDKRQTPWGPAVNLDDHGADEVRAFFIDNAVQWLRDYHLDGLRLDAVHAFGDDSETHFLAELSDAVHGLAEELGRELFLIAESDLNDPRVIARRDEGGHGIDAQWSDDFHHAVHAALTGERDGYYTDFGTLADVATALTQGFVFTGQHSAYRGKPHGAPLPAKTSGHRLLGYLQNHDQIGNRARGERATALMPTGLLYVGAALVLTSPFTPMIYMGEEWGASTPWQYFTDHEKLEVADAVREGRRSEFAAFGWQPDDVPDPQDKETFARSRLDWSELTTEPHGSVLDWYRSLIRLRSEWPDLRDGDFDNVNVEYDEDSKWLAMWRGEIVVVCNLRDETQRIGLKRGGELQRILLASSRAEVGADGHLEVLGQSVAIALG